mmetsp:Transcript_24934/g.54689  ORF Transcript_24934/g.54689 Transcript_24934/m.54689 type:complete len:229 (-) Transcript_24934:469-1155(-)
MSPAPLQQTQQLNASSSSSSAAAALVAAVETLDLEEPVIKTIPFAVGLPSSLTCFNNQNGIVGSIILMGRKSAMIWVGWGLLDTSFATATSIAKNGDDEPSNNKNDKPSSSFGTGTPTMGQLVVAMPRTNYKGAFSSTSSKEASCSQLVGSASSEDQMLANQMASRLSSRSGMAIYVSCQLSSSSSVVGAGGGGALDSGSDGPEADMLSQRAAALAEKEVWRILQEER